MCYTIDFASIHDLCLSSPRHVIPTTFVYQCWPRLLASLYESSPLSNPEDLLSLPLDLCPEESWESLAVFGSLRCPPSALCLVCEGDLRSGVIFTLVSGWLSLLVRGEG